MTAFELEGCGFKLCLRMLWEYFKLQSKTELKIVTLWWVGEAFKQSPLLLTCMDVKIPCGAVGWNGEKKGIFLESRAMFIP